MAEARIADIVVTAVLASVCGYLAASSSEWFLIPEALVAALFGSAIVTWIRSLYD